jgi:2-isopropylmalate synthase
VRVAQRSTGSGADSGGSGAPRRVVLYDTTLRDGAQQVGISLSLQDKLLLLQRLDEFGIDYVEGGWPGSNPKDREFFREARRMRLRGRLVAFGSTRRAGMAVEEDVQVRGLLEAGTPAVAVVGKSWLLHVREALGTTPEENLAMIAETVAYLKAQGREVLYDAEHFFDAAADEDGGAYALATVRAAAEAGADWIVLCDTNGGSLPEHVARWTARVCAEVRCPVGIHTHDDAGLGVANALAAVQAGARQVQGTFNGYGERCGNANLCTIIPNLVLKMGLACTPAARLSELTALSRLVSEVCNLPPLPGAPYVGPNAFAHKGGIHVSAISRNPRTYEHVPPEAVGNTREVVVSELSGASNLAYKARELGLDWLTPEGRRQLLERVKELEFQGYQFEGAEASFELLARRVLQGHRPFFETIGYSVTVQRHPGGGPDVEATVRVRVGDAVFHTAADGDGPVNAMDRALRKALEDPFPEIRNMRLCDYKVRVIDGREGTAARVRVLITTESPDGYWTTVGVSENILDASWLALVDSLEYGLLRARAREAARASGTG